MTKTKWTIDYDHSRVDFSVRHMMISNVKGTFHKFSTNLDMDVNDLTSANLDFTVDIASIDTLNNDRNGHLLSPDFFDVEKYPEMTFHSTKITKKGEVQYDVTGELTIHGVTKAETLSVTFEGEGKDPWGNEKAGFSAQGIVNRADYGLVWNTPLETGGVLVGNKAKVNLQIEVSKTK